MDARCEQCGNSSVNARVIAGARIAECGLCGHIEGPADVIELLELQREAEELGCSPDSFPLASFLNRQPGVKVLKDAGGDAWTGARAFITFSLTEHKTWPLENLGKSLRLLRDELECSWVIEYRFEFGPEFELRTRDETPAPAGIEAAQRDLALIWRRLQQYSGLGWWKK